MLSAAKHPCISLLARYRQPYARAQLGFTSPYRIDRLVYFETYTQVRAAIAREKEIKGWTRLKKLALIVLHNPEWKDLSEEWFKSIEELKAQFLAKTHA